MKTVLIMIPFLATLASGPAFAASNDFGVPSKPKCEKGQIYDKKTKSCILAKKSDLDADSLYENLRELAYAGRYDDAWVVLAQMPADDDRAMTYKGFIHRKTGNMDAATRYYKQAIRKNPANVLARSYMGQGLVDIGRAADAQAQLAEIRAHGGAGTWAEASLATAIETGRTFNY